MLIKLYKGQRNSKVFSDILKYETVCYTGRYLREEVPKFFADKITKEIQPNLLNRVLRFIEANEGIHPDQHVVCDVATRLYEEPYKTNDHIVIYMYKKDGTLEILITNHPDFIYVMNDTGKNIDKI